MRVELRHIKSFLAVADAGGVALGARHLGQAQSAVSQRVRQLEDFLGVPLLIRGRTGTALTPAGRVLAEQAAPAVAAVEASVERARRHASAGAGRPPPPA